MNFNLAAQKGKVTPTITWATPAAITYGTALSSAQLNAKADVAGSFRYMPGAGTILNAGTQTLSATFTPSNKSAYSSVTVSVYIVVNRASASITLSNLMQAYTGTPRNVTVTTNPPGVPTITTYTGIDVSYPTSSTAPINVGSYAVVSKINSSNYTGSDATATLVITQTSKIDPIITWADPTPITYGTALNKKQLNASANVAGSFVYNPKTGTILNAGMQTLTTTFTPKNTSSYNVVSKSVQIVVNKINAIVTLSNLSYTYDGSAKSATVTTNPAGLSYSITYNGSVGVPVNAGSYAVVATITDPNYNGSSSGTLVIDKASASMNLSNLEQEYDGSPKAVTVATVPSGLSGVVVTYDGSTSLPTAVGSYSVEASLNNENYQASNVTGTLVIKQTVSQATVILSNLSYTYDGSAKSATVTTNPVGLSYSITYNGSVGVPVNAGSYAVVATITDPNYNGSSSGTLVIDKASASMNLSNLEQEYDGSPKAVTVATVPSGLSGVVVTYDGSTSVPASVGSYSVEASLNNENYQASNVTGTLVIKQTVSQATVILSNLSYTYDGSAKSATVTTNPAGLSYSITYNGSTDAPINAGSYAVVATITDPNYNGSSSGTMVIDKATPVINWSNPAAIKYGVALSSAQLNATSTVIGNFNYSPVAGTVLHAGTRTLTADFTPTDAVNYNTVNGTTVLLVINKDSIYVRANDKTRPYGIANPTFDAGYFGGKVKIVILGSSTAQGVGASDASHKWTYLLSQRLAIEYGSATVSMSNLADGTLNTYAILPTGTDNGSRTAVDPNRNITAALALNPQIILINMPSNDVANGYTSTETMNNFATIINTARAAGVKVILTGTQPRGDIDLSSRQLLQSENQSLLSVYGSDCVNIYDELTDFSDYTIKAIYRATNNVIHLNDAGHNYIYTQVFPLVKAWIEANTTGFVNGDGPSNLSGSLNLNTSATISSPAGTYNISAGGNLSSSDYNVYYKPGVLTVTPATSIVNWNTPSNITYGTPLSSQQLNATSSIPGTFVYTPASGTVLNAGTQTLSVTFTPTDQTNYKPVTTSVTLTVTKAPLVVRADDKTRAYGQENPTFTASYLGGKVKIAVLGSSTAAGVGASNYNNSWVGLVTANLGTDYPYITTSISNLAVGGYSTYQILPTGTVNPANRPAVDEAHNITAALALNPQIILINLPSNDVASGYTSEETMNNFATIINAARAAGVKVILTGTQPRGDISSTARQFLQTENQMMLDAYGDDCINIYTELTDFDTYSVKAIYNSGDNIHLNDAGHNYIYTKMYPPLKAWIAANCSGFVNGDGPGSLSGTLDLTTTATADSPAGTYPISASGSLSSPNYEISYETGVLTVTDQIDVTPPTGLRTSDNSSKINGSDMALSAWPNPFSNNMTVRIKSGIKGHAALTLHDLNGTPVRQLYNGEVVAGSEKSVQVSGQGLAAGMYVLRLIIGSTVVTKKIVVVR